MRTLLLGEALVDLVCERHVDDIADADAFVPHFGGAAANVAVAAARAGAEVALAGGAGADAWGRWVERRLRSEGVGLDHFRLLPGRPTPVAFVTVDASGEPSFTLYGESIAAAVEAVAGELDEAVDAADGLFLGSNTLVGERERELSLAARERALAADKAVIFDPNVRLHRWASRTEATQACRQVVRDALLVKCNADEAHLLTGERDPEKAAAALLRQGARHVVVTLGAQGAILRGEFRASVRGSRARVVSTLGAGDALMGALLARLTITGFYPPAIAAGLQEGVELAARATERWGAL